MPTYVYEILTASGEPTGRTFELHQSIKDEPLATHPETREPVRRVIQPPYLPGQFSEAVSRSAMKNEKRLGELGFTKYQKSGDGVYEKRVGKGPDIIKRG
ncbi:MAG: zinc ribbon domain-containing protein [Planctomycetota bacterium]|nr:zinc ribbon domain-containing protein [Planctomycetota bacterium]